MTALAATSTMGTLSQAPMAPSAAAMAAAQAIVAARALQAHAAQMQAQSAGDSSGSSDEASKAVALKKTIQVSNLSPLLTVDHLKQLFGYCGTVVDCTITESKHFAYIEYCKAEEATAALALNNMDVGGRPLNVEMAKSLPSKSAPVNSSLPLVMQQAVAMQQMQFQQALMMQQALASQQAAARAATMKSATEMASARAAEISRKLKAEGLVGDDKEVKRKSRSPSTSRRESKSQSRSPVKYRRSRHSQSLSPPMRHSRERRSRSPVSSRHSRRVVRSYRDVQDLYSRRRERDRSRDHYSSISRRNQSRSSSPQLRKSSRAGSRSPKHPRESASSRTKRSSRVGSRSPRHYKSSRSSPVNSHRSSSRRSGHSRSRSVERRHHSNDKEETRKTEKLKQDYRRSERSNESSKDAKRTRDTKESKAVACSIASPKRSSLSPEDEILKKEKGMIKHKRSKLDDSCTEKADIENKDRKVEGEYSELIRGKRSAHSSTSRQHRSLEDGDVNKHAENQDSSRYETSKASHRRHDKSDSATRERDPPTFYSTCSRGDKRSSRHSSSRSHRSSRHLEEGSLNSTIDQNVVMLKEDITKTSRSEAVSWESQVSDDMQDKTDNCSKSAPYKSSTCPTEDEFLGDLKASTGDRSQDVTLSGMKEDCSVNNVTCKVSPTEVGKFGMGTNDHTENKEANLPTTTLGSYSSIKNKENVEKDPADVDVESKNITSVTNEGHIDHEHSNLDEPDSSHVNQHSSYLVAHASSLLQGQANGLRSNEKLKEKSETEEFVCIQTSVPFHHGNSNGAKDMSSVEKDHGYFSRDLTNMVDISSTNENSTDQISKIGFGGHSMNYGGEHGAPQNAGVAESPSLSNHSSSDKVPECSDEDWTTACSSILDAAASSSLP